MGGAATMTQISKIEDIRELTTEETTVVAGGQGSGGNQLLCKIDRILDCLPGAAAAHLDAFVDCLLHKQSNNG
jgi:hypothetical protein